MAERAALGPGLEGDMTNLHLTGGMYAIYSNYILTHHHLDTLTHPLAFSLSLLLQPFSLMKSPSELSELHVHRLLSNPFSPFEIPF